MKTQLFVSIGAMALAGSFLINPQPAVTAPVYRGAASALDSAGQRTVPSKAQIRASANHASSPSSAPGGL
jgi:hypothetical protein